MPKNRSLLLPLVLAAVVAAAVGYLGWRQTVPRVQVEISPPLRFVGAQSAVTLTLRASKGRVESVEVRLVQGEGSVTAAQQSFPEASPPEPSLRATLDARALGLREGPATLEVYARDTFWRPLGSGTQPKLSLPVTVDLTPPSLEVVSSTRYVAQGGGGLAVLSSRDAARLGVLVGGILQPAFPAGPAEGGLAVAMFVLPWDLPPKDLAIVAFAQDEAGNTTLRPIPSEIKPRAFPSDTIEISQTLLTSKVPELLPQLAGRPEDELLAGFLKINRDQRREAEEGKRRIGATTRPVPLWDGPFSQAANTKVFANFAETRTYRYQGRAVDTQIHLGYDLASLKQAPVLAANSGAVVFTGPITIYGNTVVLDHGLGLQTLYAHLSSIGVKAGDAVQKGQELGRTGSTGLALGDHLHYEVLIHGVSVTPLEWWDGKWIRDHIHEPLSGAGLSLFPSQAAKSQPETPALRPPPPARKKRPAKQ